PAVSYTISQLRSLTLHPYTTLFRSASQQEQSGAAAKHLADLQQQGAEATAALADLQTKLKAEQGQLDAAPSERDKALAAAANAKSQLSGLEQQSDAAAKSLASQQEQSGAAAKNL